LSLWVQFINSQQLAPQKWHLISQKTTLPKIPGRGKMLLQFRSKGGRAEI